jgi:hypothetical protein
VFEPSCLWQDGFLILPVLKLQAMEIKTLAPLDIRPALQLKAIPQLKAQAEIAVIGAGAFGGWTALHLLRMGHRVTLVDAFGPGNSRSSSGDETRVIRSTYGANETYFNLNRRALQLWQQNQEQWGKKLFYPTGVLWLCYHEQMHFIEASQPFMAKHGLTYEYLTAEEAHYRYPLINFTDLDHAVFDAEAGYLLAREGCRAVVEAFVQEGGVMCRHRQPLYLLATINCQVFTYPMAVCCTHSLTYGHVARGWDICFLRFWAV